VKLVCQQFASLCVYVWAEGLWLPLYEVCTGAAVAALQKPVGTQVGGMEPCVELGTEVFAGRYAGGGEEILC